MLPVGTFYGSRANVAMSQLHIGLRWFLTRKRLPLASAVKAIAHRSVVLTLWLIGRVLAFTNPFHNHGRNT